MEIIQIYSNDNLADSVYVLNTSHNTVAELFGFTKATNPTNNAFIDESTLKFQLEKGIELYGMLIDRKLMACIAIEKSKRDLDTYYIEKVSVIPAYRNKGYGTELINFALAKIKEMKGKRASLSLIDSYTVLKQWYSVQGFVEISTKDFEHLPFRVCFMSKELIAVE